MINRPRMNPYTNMAGWDEEVAKAEARKAAPEPDAHLDKH